MFSLYCSLCDPSFIQCTHVNKDNKKNRKADFHRQKQKSFCSHNHKWNAAVDWMASQLPAVYTPPSSHYLWDWADTGGWCACAYVCPTPLWPLSWTRTLPALGEMVDCGNDRAVLQCTGLNVKLIFNVWHFTQIIPPQTWPWGIPQIAFSVPQQLWNYSSQWEREKEARRGRRGGSLWVWRNDRPLAALAILDWKLSLTFSLWYHDRRAMPNWKHLGSLEAVWNNHILCVV